MEMKFNNSIDYLKKTFFISRDNCRGIFMTTKIHTQWTISFLYRINKGMKKQSIYKSRDIESKLVLLESYDQSSSSLSLLTRLTAFFPFFGLGQTISKCPTSLQAMHDFPVAGQVLNL